MNNLEVAFGAYRAQYDDDGIDRYYLRPSSYYLLHLDRREESFTCDSVTLTDSEYFQIYQDDRVGACLKDGGGTEFLDILAEDDNYRVGSWGGSSGQCREGNMMQSSEEPDTTSGFVLHLYVEISWFFTCVIRAGSRDLNKGGFLVTPIATSTQIGVVMGVALLFE